MTIKIPTERAKTVDPLQQVDSYVTPEGQMTVEQQAALLEASAKLSFRRTNIVPIHTQKQHGGDLPTYEFTEHMWLGDSIIIPDDKGFPHQGKDLLFGFQSGVIASYGCINAMAGDFYGTDQPISDGDDLDDRRARFMAAYNTLAECDGPRVQIEFGKLLTALRAEVDAVNADPTNSAYIYAHLPDISVALQAATIGRPSGQPSYAGLALINWDHFGERARTVWSVGHQLAMEEAVKGRTQEHLYAAYCLNAFADHFLGDAFAAGHLRTPRKYLHSILPVRVTPDLCAQYMHDEDNAIGLDVVSAADPSTQWRAYGDKMLLDPLNDENRRRLTLAAQQSVTEIYSSWLAQEIIAPAEQKVMGMMPTLESAQGPQELAALFRGSKRRTNITDRRTGGENAYTTYWNSETTWLWLKNSGWWVYKMTMDGGGPDQ